MKPILDIIIPTWNNPDYLRGAVSSLINNAMTEGIFHIYVVNNGHPKSCDWINSPYVTVLETGGKNLGWEGGLDLGLKHSKSPFVCFFNDDAYVPLSSKLWMNQLLVHFKDPVVGAVGPSSNVVMGMQNIFATIPYTTYPARFLIGFCVILRREALDKIGGIDLELVSGDDFDWSIRLRKAGYKLLADRSVFIYHHGFKTGERVHGDAAKPFGWNSQEFQERTDLAIIKKHGFAEWWNTKMGAIQIDEKWLKVAQYQEDKEGQIIRELVDEGVIIDLGCGDKKTVGSAIGVDLVKYDKDIQTLTNQPKSQADIVADVSQPLPFEEKSVDTIIARHILEHMEDPILILEQWAKVLKKGGKLILALPDERIRQMLPANIEHKHTFIPEFAQNLLKKTGFKIVKQIDTNNNVSFIIVGEKK